MANPAPHSEKVALVTGAARGTGLAIAEALAGTGASVFLLDIGRDIPGIPYSLSDDAALVRAVASLQRIHDRIFALRCDVRRAEEVEQALAAIEARAGRLDILVNNAGVLVLKPLPELSEEEWDAQFDVMVKGPFHLCRGVLPGMNRRGWGRIVNVASVAGLRAIGTGTAYTAAKHALIGLTRALAMEVANQNITVNAVCPGTMPTALISGTAKALGLSPEEALEQFSERHLTGRPIQPEEVAQAVLWLTSDGAARVNGASLFVDDGWHTH